MGDLVLTVGCGIVIVLASMLLYCVTMGIIYGITYLISRGWRAGQKC